MDRGTPNHARTIVPIHVPWPAAPQATCPSAGDIVCTYEREEEVREPQRTTSGSGALTEGPRLCAGGGQFRPQYSHKHSLAAGRVAEVAIRTCTRRVATMIR